MLDFLTERIGAEAKHRCPENGAGGIEEEKARPRHAIDAGEERSQDPEQRHEAPEEDNLAAVPLEQILSDFDAPLVEADIASIADEQAETDLSPDPIADIVADDGACRSSGGGVAVTRLLMTTLGSQWKGGFPVSI